MNPQRTVDFNKISWAEKWYVNQEGVKRRTLPRDETVHGLDVDWRVQAASHPDYPHETMLERARRLDIIDRWTAVCKLVVAANRHIYYFGEDAHRVFKAYNAHIYGH